MNDLSTRTSGESAPGAVEAGDVRHEIAPDGVATISFFHPKGNSLPAWLLKELAHTVTRVGEDERVRAIVLRSDGTGPFCAGASFDELARITDAESGREFFMGFARLILAMRICPKPIVARVHGKVAGGGVGIVAASDYAIALHGAALRLSELAVGIGPFVVGPVVERKIGVSAFAAMSLDAHWRSAEWGESHGLYARLCDVTAELDSQVQVMAQQLAKANPDAVRLIKEATWRGTDDWPALLQERATTSGRLVLSEHTRRAIAEFGRR